MVADRESDIYEQFARRPKGMQLLTRAAHDRCLAKAGRLFATIAAWLEQYRETIMVPEQLGREARTACLALRFGAVSLRRPTTAGKTLATSVDLFMVDVAEVDAPPGAEALQWRLLTTPAVTTAEQACQVIAWYRHRWTIEQVFRTLKSAGVQLDQSQVTQAQRFVKLAIVGLIAAVRIMQVVTERNGQARQSMADAMPVLKVSARTLLPLARHVRGLATAASLR